MKFGKARPNQTIVIDRTMFYTMDGQTGAELYTRSSLKGVIMKFQYRSKIRLHVLCDLINTGCKNITNSERP